jgi:hypothetical protein
MTTSHHRSIHRKEKVNDPSPHCKDKRPKNKYSQKELCGLSPNFHIHVSVSDTYIPELVCLFRCRKKCGLILGIYESLTDTWIWKWGLRPRNSLSGIFKWDFRCRAAGMSLLGLGTEFRSKKFRGIDSERFPLFLGRKCAFRRVPRKSQFRSSERNGTKWNSAGKKYDSYCRHGRTVIYKLLVAFAKQ